MAKSKKTKDREIVNIFDAFTSFSELVDKLSIENIRLWNLKDEVMRLKEELNCKKISKKRREAILEELAQLAFKDVDIVKKRSALKKAIDETFVRNVQAIINGKKVVIMNEHKNYGGSARKRKKHYEK